MPRGGSREHDPTWLPSLAPYITRICANCARDELTGADARIDGWDISGCWFGVFFGGHARTGELPRGQTIPWRLIAARSHHANNAARADQPEPP